MIERIESLLKFGPKAEGAELSQGLDFPKLNSGRHRVFFVSFLVMMGSSVQNTDNDKVKHEAHAVQEKCLFKCLTFWKA